MKSTPACTNTHELINQMVKDGWENIDILAYFNNLGFDHREIKNTINKIRINKDLTRIIDFKNK
jgi:hypothetical protein